MVALGVSGACRANKSPLALWGESGASTGNSVCSELTGTPEANLLRDTELDVHTTQSGIGAHLRSQKHGGEICNELNVTTTDRGCLIRTVQWHCRRGRR